MDRRPNGSLILRREAGIFMCPICGTDLKIDGLKSLYCANRHTYDVSKYGYINFTNKPDKTKYDNELFKSRRKLFKDDGFFEPLSQTLVKQIIKSQTLKSEQIAILDAGSGEGSHLTDICKNIGSTSDKDVLGVGIDLSKEGVLAASKRYPNQIWAVADLANPPFRDRQFDFIFNILSPSNYTQFLRLLKDDGLVVKVIPNSDHLRELRDHLKENRDGPSYTNAKTIRHFKKSFRQVDSLNLRYTKHLNKQSLSSVVKMTPLSWAASEERINDFLDQDSANITVDLDILVGRKY